MNSLIDGLNKALKYSRERLPVSAIHPELRFTRLGSVLREHATEPSDVGELAYQALTSPHDQPLELMPLHLLRDKMQEEPDHPLAKRFTWQTVPERIRLDSLIEKHVNDNPSNYRDAGSAFTEILRHNLPATGDLDRIHAELPNVTEEELGKAFDRLTAKNYRRAATAQAMVAGFKSEPEDYHSKLATGTSADDDLY